MLLTHKDRKGYFCSLSRRKEPRPCCAKVKSLFLVCFGELFPEELQHEFQADGLLLTLKDCKGNFCSLSRRKNQELVAQKLWTYLFFALGIYFTKNYYMDTKFSFEIFPR